MQFQLYLLEVMGLTNERRVLQLKLVEAYLTYYNVLSVYFLT